MSFRIGIVGCAGTGKSSLARALSQKLRIPALESKRITQDILERDKYDYASGVQIERFLAHTGRQNEILRRTVEQEEGASEEGFVTDRTVVDLAAYVVCELKDLDVEALQHIFNTCQRRVKEYTHLFLCPWREEPMSGNDRRTLNPWYQFQIHAVDVGILGHWGCSYVPLKETETGPRVEEVLGVLGVTIP
jgi:predicted ATPase